MGGKSLPYLGEAERPFTRLIHPDMNVCKASRWETAPLKNRLSSYTKDKVANSITFMPLRKSSSIETGELFVKLADQLPEGSLGHLYEEPGYDSACHLLQGQTQPVLPSPQIPGQGWGTEQPTLWRLHTPLMPQKVPNLSECLTFWGIANDFPRNYIPF